MCLCSYKNIANSPLWYLVVKKVKLPKFLQFLLTPGLKKIPATPILILREVYRKILFYKFSKFQWINVFFMKQLKISTWGGNENNEFHKENH